jgi:tellurite methyltransferase
MSDAGGYDDGYKSCNCFWGIEPGSLIKLLTRFRSNFAEAAAWDIGCGEGKNAIHLARLGAVVDAWDISAFALDNARKAWEDNDIVNWRLADARTTLPVRTGYDYVVMYGLLHCLRDRNEVMSLIAKTQDATKVGGLHIVVAFNDRMQDLSAHPNLNPTLLSHTAYLNAYDQWRILHESDQDLHETHPHNCISHTHSMTRLIAEKI